MQRAFNDFLMFWSTFSTLWLCLTVCIISEAESDIKLPTESIILSADSRALRQGSNVYFTDYKFGELSKINCSQFNILIGSLGQAVMCS